MSEGRMLSEEEIDAIIGGLSPVRGFMPRSDVIWYERLLADRQARKEELERYKEIARAAKAGCAWGDLPFREGSHYREAYPMWAERCDQPAPRLQQGTGGLDQARMVGALVDVVRHAVRLTRRRGVDYVKGVQIDRRPQRVTLHEAVGVPGLWHQINPDDLKAGVGISHRCSSCPTKQIQESRLAGEG